MRVNPARIATGLILMGVAIFSPCRRTCATRASVGVFSTFNDFNNANNLNALFVASMPTVSRTSTQLDDLASANKRCTP
jgi:hypothetical protein